MSKDELGVNDLSKVERSVEKKKKFNVMSFILIIIGVACIGISIFGLYGIYKEYKTAVDRYDNLEDEFVQIYTTQMQETEIETTEEAPQVPWYQLASVDLEKIQKKYSDVVGWIFFEDGLISYPVMQAEDNNKYLYSTYDGRESKSGSIFMETTNSSDFSDTHTLIYGHNMKNLSMFGRLKHYRTKAGYYDEHKYFQIFCGDEILRYQIFAYQEVPIDSFVYQEYFTSAKELSNLLLKKSIINPGVTIKEDDKIITLSTCTADDAHRFVVSAVLIERYSLED